MAGGQRAAERRPEAVRPGVLLVDDDPGDQALVRRAVRDARWHLDVVSGATEAIDYLSSVTADAARRRPHLVLLDLNLDGASGFDVLRSIRATPALQGTVVVVLTTSADEADVRRSYELGANSFVTKPSRLDDWRHNLQMLERYWLEVARLPDIDA